MSLGVLPACLPACTFSCHVDALLIGMGSLSFAFHNAPVSLLWPFVCVRLCVTSHVNGNHDSASDFSVLIGRCFQLADWRLLQVSRRLQEAGLKGMNITVKVKRRAEGAPIEPYKLLGCGEKGGRD